MKKRLNRKWYKLLAATGIVAVMFSSVFGAVKAIHSTTNSTMLSTSSKSTKDNNKTVDNSSIPTPKFKKVAQRNYKVVDGLYLNISSTHPNIYVSAINDWTTGNGKQIVDLAIKEASLKNNWTNDQLPDGLVLSLDTKDPFIKEYRNPKLNISTPAIRLKAKGNNNLVLPDVIVSIVGGRTIPGSTFPIDLMSDTPQASNPNNTNASFIYTPANQNAKVAPTPDELKDFLFGNDKKIASLFSNFPDVAATSKFNDGEFSVSKNDVTIANLHNDQGNDKYNIYNYSLSLNSYFAKTNDVLSIVHNQPKTFNLSVYIPTILQDGDQSDSTWIKNIIDISSFPQASNGIFTDNNLNPETASEFDSIRRNQNDVFKRIMISLLSSPENSINFPDRLFPNELDVNLTPIGGQTVIDNHTGSVIYNVVLKKVKYNGIVVSDENRWINIRVAIGGFKKINETLYAKEISVAGINNLSEKAASEFYNKENDQNILSLIANSQNPPLVYYGGSYKDHKNSSLVAKLFKSATATYDFNEVEFDDKNGYIKNVKVSLTGYYNKNYEYKEKTSDAKVVTLNISGFKKQAGVESQTIVNTIFAPEEYVSFPAQAFLVSQDQLVDGYLPLTPDNLNEYFIQNRIDVLRQLVTDNTVSLPKIAGNEPEHWEFSEIKINNFQGVISGKVKFPYYYSALPNGNVVIMSNNNIPSNEAPVLFDFSIEGFNPVPGATGITDLKTTSVIEVSDFGSLVEVPANEVLLSGYNPSNEQNLSTIRYWSEQKDRLFSNTWDTFLDQLTNKDVGAKVTAINKDQKMNTFTITFNTCVFDANGEFRRSNDINIEINDFNQDDIKQKPTFIVNLPINIPPQAQSLSSKDVENIVNLGQSFNNYGKAEFLRDLSLVLNESYVKNIKVETPPVYELGRATLVPDSPGQLKLDIRIVNNYYDDNGTFISTTNPNGPLQTITLVGFDQVGNTELSPQIRIEGFSEVRASDAVNISNGVDSNPNVQTIKKLILDNLYSPKPSDELPKEEVISYITPADLSDPTYPDHSTYVKEKNGEIYFGSVNNFEGSVTINLKFNANKWYQDNELKNEDKLLTVKILGFKEITPFAWYNEYVELNTKNLTRDNGDELASNLIGIEQNINTQTSPYYKTLSQVWNKLFLETEQAQIIKDSIFDWQESFAMSTEKADCIVSNQSGEIIMTFSLYGDNVIDPNTGLIYTRKEHPFKFKVNLSGFINVTPTVVEPNKVINLSGVSDRTAPSTSYEIFNHFATFDNYKRMTNGTLPPGWQVDFDLNRQKYSYIPYKTRNGEINVETDFSTGTIRIKQFVISYYFTNKYELYKSKDTFFDQQGNLDWAEIDKRAPDALVVENLVISGFKQMEATTIKQTVDFPNVESILAHDYLFPNGIQLTGEQLAKKLIFNKEENEDKVNNLHLFFENYYNSSLDYAPEFVINNIVEDNISGSIKFELQLTNHYFIAHDNGVKFVDNHVPGPKANVTVRGFKQVSQTTIRSEANISTIKSSLGDAASASLDDIFYYNVIQGFDTPDLAEQARKERLLLLIRDNYSFFINNPIDIENYLHVPVNELVNYFDVSDIFTNYKEGTITFKLSLYSYVSADGIIYRDIKNSPDKVLESQVSIIGFKSKQPTSPNTLLNGGRIEINISHFSALENLDYFCAEDEFKIALIMSASDDGTKSSVLTKLFRNMPPEEIYRFLSTSKPSIDSGELIDPAILTGLEIMRFDPASEVGSNNPTRTGRLKLKNVLVATNDVPSKTIIGDYEIDFVLTGFSPNVETKVHSEWNLSLYPSSNPATFDTSKLVEGQVSTELKEFFNKEVVINGINKPLWTAFFVNPIYVKNGSNNTDLTFKVLKNEPATGAVTVELSYVNSYDQNGRPSTQVRSSTIVIKGFNIQTSTSIKSHLIQLNSLPKEIKILPSELNNSTEKQELLLNELNKPLYIENLFSAPIKLGDNKTKITRVDIQKFNDEQGVIQVAIEYMNYYDNFGVLNSTTPASSGNELIKISGFNNFLPTTQGIKVWDVVKFYGSEENIPVVSSTNQKINRLLPSEVLKIIESDIEAEETNDGKLVKLLDWVKRITVPVYNSEGTQANALDFTTVSGTTNLVSNGTGLLNAGKIQIWSNDKYTDSPNEEDKQNLKTIKTRINMHSDGGTNLSKVFNFDDREGSISFDLEYTNFWGAKQQNGSYVKSILTPADNGGVQQLSLKINGFRQNIETETNITNISIIIASVASAIVIIVILVAFLLWLWKFGIGSH